jgi:NO-binding membrane sensor protein with MHYT domain/signal transduction histidine kinase/CheY-like chemotaxis protein
MPVSGAHDAVLVVLSIFIATFASYTALDLAGRVRSASGTARHAWLATAALVTGCGIWSMHFVAILAYSVPLPVEFDLLATIVSLVLPIVVTGFAFRLAAGRDSGRLALVTGGVVMGSGIGLMHYTGMGAMRIAADLHHDWVWVVVSVLIAVGASIAALWLGFRTSARLPKVTAAALMGLAISGMHYSAMHGARFSVRSGADQVEGSSGLGQVNLALAVTLVTCLVLALALGASAFDRRASQDEGAESATTRSKGELRRAPRYLVGLLIGSLLVPMVVFALAAWQNWLQLESVAEDRARKRANLIAEHALKVFQTNEQVLNRVDEKLQVVTEDRISATVDFNRYLAGIANELDHLGEVGVVGVDGRLLAVSHSLPTPRIEASWQDHVIGAVRAGGKVYISAPVMSRIQERTVLRMSRQRKLETGTAGGVLYASIYPDYFARFYRSITGGEDSVTMARADGTVLVRDPGVTTGIEVLSPRSGFIRGIQGSPSGLYRTVSELDQVGRIHAYQRIGEYPVYVSYGLSLAALGREWRANLLAFGTVAGLAALALMSLSLYALRRAKQERRLFGQWQTELERRQTAEEALRQSQKMEAVGQLTGGIAHDFNNLLTVISGNLEFAGRAIEKSNLPKAYRNIEAALAGSQRAASLTHRLLAFSRRQPLQPQVVDLNKLVAGLTDIFRRTLGESIQVETVLAGGLWPTFADPNQLESALLNLVINARDAMPGGGRLTIETANCHLDDAYAATHPDVRAGQYVLVAVTDTGTGMTPETKAQAFEPFFTTKEIGQGTGLGLSMIYGFVKQSGGHVKLYSELGQGTVVKIYLSRTTHQGAVEEPRARAIAPTQRHETILVVEDDPDVRTYSVETLTGLGYRVVEARNADMALAAFDAHPEIDLLFTDVGLPGMNGRELADEVRRRRPGVSILFTSGYTRNAIVHNGMLDPGVHLLNKPFTMEQLAAKVREVLEAEWRTG